MGDYDEFGFSRENEERIDGTEGYEPDEMRQASGNQNQDGKQPLWNSIDPNEAPDVTVAHAARMADTDDDQKEDNISDSQTEEHTEHLIMYNETCTSALLGEGSDDIRRGYQDELASEFPTGQAIVNCRSVAESKAKLNSLQLIPEGDQILTIHVKNKSKNL